MTKLNRTYFQFLKWTLIINKIIKILTDQMNRINALSMLTNIVKNKVIESDNMFTIVAKIGDFISFMF